MTLSALILITFLSGCAKKVAVATPTPPTLGSRYTVLNCSVVQIVHPGGIGTGFFISADGDVLTAAHVAMNYVIDDRQPGQPTITMDYRPGIAIHRNGHEPVTPTWPRITADDIQNATADLAVLRTGIRTDCFLRLGMPAQLVVGDHLISIGYPVSAPTGALYDGFLSARYQHLQIPMAYTLRGFPVFPTYEVLRVQMPITPGASGSPVIAEDNTVIGVISEVPVTWFNDITGLINFEQMRTRNFTVGVPAGDVLQTLGELALIVQEFETPGAGLAVPVSYLHWTARAEQK
jgi:Trypsin-like peptidase domain